MEFSTNLGRFYWMNSSVAFICSTGSFQPMVSWYSNKQKIPWDFWGKLKELLGIQSFTRVWGWAYWKCTGKRSEWESGGRLGRKTRRRRIVKTRREGEKKKKTQLRKINKRGTARQQLSRGTSPYVHSWICETVSNTPLSSPDSDTSRGI